MGTIPRRPLSAPEGCVCSLPPCSPRQQKQLGQSIVVLILTTLYGDKSHQGNFQRPIDQEPIWDIQHRWHGRNRHTPRRWYYRFEGHSYCQELRVGLVQYYGGGGMVCKLTDAVAMGAGERRRTSLGLVAVVHRSKKCFKTAPGTGSLLENYVKNITLTYYEVRLKKVFPRRRNSTTDRKLLGIGRK